MIYMPSGINVPVGSTVTLVLVNGPDSSHPLGFEPSIAWTITYSGKDTWLTYTFVKAGTYSFFRTIHGATGTIVVV